MIARKVTVGLVVSSVNFTDDTIDPHQQEENVVKPGLDGFGNLSLSSHPKIAFR